MNLNDFPGVKNSNIFKAIFSDADFPALSPSKQIYGVSLKFHNLNIWYSALFELPLLGSIGPIPILICLFLFLIGLGRYLNIPNYLHFFTLEKIYIPYSFIYFLNLFLSRII